MSEALDGDDSSRTLAIPKSLMHASLLSLFRFFDWSQ